MIQEPFADGNSPLHTVDPCYRLVGAVLYSFIVALSYRPETLICALVGSFFLLMAAKLNLLQVIKRLSVLLGFLVLLWAILRITYDGTILTRIGPFDIARQGVVLSLQITAKSVSILTAFMALIATMTIATLGHTLGRLGVPDKIVYLLLMTYRYIFVIEQEYQRLRTAVKIRGFKPGTNLHTYRTYAYLVGMLFVRASTRAQRVGQAMRCRGFNGKFYSLYRFTFTPYNHFFIILFLGLSLILVMLEWGIFTSPLHRILSF
ncbi:MAG: cobalt ECF transporter T component CbiQ [Desulfobacteraceae bacterium]